MTIAGLLETRKRLFEDCGAEVFTARGSPEPVRVTSNDPVDLVLVDATNVGLEHGEKLCGLVKSLRPVRGRCIAHQARIWHPNRNNGCSGDSKDGPSQKVGRINELLRGCLDVDLWEKRADDEDEGRSMGEPT
jgi:hypothetical protein